MSDPFRQFDIDLNQWLDKAEGRLDAFVREFSNDMARNIIIDTPVDTGFCRANWSAYLNDEYKPLTVAPKGNKGDTVVYPSAGEVMSALSMVLAQAEAGDTVHIFNNCEYVRVLEDGYGDRPARNFVKGNLARGEQIAKEVLQRIGVR